MIQPIKGMDMRRQGNTKEDVENGGTKDTLLMVLPVILAVLAVAAAVFLILKFTTGGKKAGDGDVHGKRYRW